MGKKEISNFLKNVLSSFFFISFSIRQHLLAFLEDNKWEKKFFNKNFLEN